MVGVAREGKASTSFIQRHFQIGYNRAASLVERMESQTQLLEICTSLDKDGNGEITWEELRDGYEENEEFLFVG